MLEASYITFFLKKANHHRYMFFLGGGGGFNLRDLIYKGQHLITTSLLLISIY